METVEIVLDSGGAIRRAQQFIAQCAPYWITKGTPLRLTITAGEQTNTTAQKRYWNGPVLDAISAQAKWNGRQYPKEFWKEYYRRRYLLKDEMVTPDGEIMQVYWSTADRSFTARMMAEFLEKVQHEAITDWGVIFDA